MGCGNQASEHIHVAKFRAAHVFIRKARVLIILDVRDGKVSAAKPLCRQTRPHRSVGIHEREDHVHARPLLKIVEQLADVLLRKRSRARRDGNGRGLADRWFGHRRIRQQGKRRQSCRDADSGRRLQRFTPGHGLINHDEVLVNRVSKSMDRLSSAWSQIHLEGHAPSWPLRETLPRAPQNHKTVRIEQKTTRDSPPAASIPRKTGHFS